MREAVVLLPRPGAGLDVIDGRQVAAPLDLPGDLDELGVLHHHGVHDAQERLVAGEDGGTASQCVALHEALAVMLRQHLDHSSAVRPRVLVPLEVALGVVEDGVQLVALQFVGRKEPDGLGVLLEHLVEEGACHLHTALVGTLLHGEFLPIDLLEADVGVVSRLDLAELLLILAWDDVEDGLGGLPVLDELADSVARQPVVKRL